MRCRKEGELTPRDMIVDAAAELFMQQGIKNTSMDDIARATGMSKKTLYTHFDDKEDLLIACIEQRFAESEHIIEQMRHNGSTVLETVMNHYRDHAANINSQSPNLMVELRKYPRAMQTMMAMQEKHLDTARKFYELGVEQGVFIEGPNYELIARLSMLLSGQPIPSSIAQRYTMADLSKVYLYTFIRSITTERGRRIFDDTLSER